MYLMLCTQARESFPMLNAMSITNISQIQKIIALYSYCCPNRFPKHLFNSGITDQKACMQGEETVAYILL